MNRLNLDNILNQYIDKYDMLDDPNGNDEGYKWRAESCFKENWDIDAKDFASMFKSAFKEMSNLIDNSTVQPVGGILLLLNQPDEIEFVRENFRDLFSEDDGDIDLRQHRIESFIEKINAHIKKYVKDSWKYPQQRNNVIYYLNLWKPEENYIFKATEAREWANCIEFGDDFGSGAAFSLKKYYNMCDELLNELLRNETIMGLYNSRLQKEARGFNDHGHILVYDVIYCAHAYNLYKNVPSLQKLSTKQRLNLAKTAEEREDLLEKLAELNRALEELSTPIQIPDLSGEKCFHKLWGEGKILKCEGSIIEIEFNEGIKKLQYPECINRFIDLDNKSNEEIFKEYLTNKEKRKSMENEVKCVQRKLNILQKGTES